MPSFLVHPIFEIIRFFARIYFRVFHGIRVHGLEHLPKEGAYVVAPNHQSSLDGFIAGHRVPGKVHCVVEGAYFRKGFSGFMLRNFRGIPLGGPRDRKGYGKILKVLGEGHPVILFPEGRRSLDGVTTFPVQAGAARLAHTAGVPIVPTTLVGAYEVLPRKVHFPRLWKPLVVRYYPPIPCHKTEDRELLKERIEAVNQQIEKRYRRRLAAWQRLRSGRQAKSS
jgi:1-acyl-sn-glycerol-3-phosphate acyltransferase